MSDWTHALRARLASLRLPPAREAEIIEELSQHLDDRRQDLIAGGAPRDEATRLVSAELSAATLLEPYLAPLRQARVHAIPPTGAPSQGMWLRGGWRADLRDAWRAIRRTPLQTATIVLSLTIGSTLTVLMFGVVNAMVGGEMPGVRDRATLVRLGLEREGDRRPRGILMGEFQRLPPAVPGLASIGGELSWRFSANVKGQAVATSGMFVTGAYFSTLATSPVLGRLIAPDDDDQRSPPVVVISHQFWRRHFDGSGAALGASIQIGTGTYQIIGVLPRQFIGLDVGDFGQTSDERAHLWLPMSQMWIYPDYSPARVLGTRMNGAVGPRMIGRLAPDLTPLQAASRAQSIAAALGDDGTAALAPLRVRLTPFRLLPSGDPLQTTVFITVLMSVPLIVLGIACANVAGIQLARAAGRTHEISIRMSLGASRRRVARMVAVETLLMSSMAGALAWAAATQTLRLAGDVLPFAVISDVRVFQFALLLPIGITLVAGFAPAWRATGVNVLAGLQRGPRAGRAAGPRFRRAVVIGQVALSVFLLVTASFLIRALTSLGTAIGPLQENVIAATVSFSDLQLDAARARQVRPTVMEGVGRLPGVTDVALSTSSSLFSGSASLCWVAPADTTLWSSFIAVGITPRFFDTLGIRIRQGRVFAAGDGAGVVIVNEAFFAELQKQGRGLGSVIPVREDDPGRAPQAPQPVRGPGAPQAAQSAQVIGVVEDSYERVPRGFARPRCYLPMPADWAGTFTVFARSESAASLVPNVQQILGGIDPRMSSREIGTVGTLVRTRYRWLYWVTDSLSAVSLIALLLSAVGLFALMSYSVSQRTSEFGLRLALGALPRNISTSVIREAMTVTLLGTAIGVLAAVPMAGILGNGVLTTISWRDPAPAAIVATLLLAVGVIASLAPAIRVSRIDPVRSLRQE